jgi:ABC-type antimicrobial peptide transport system permease subunit
MYALGFGLPIGIAAIMKAIGKNYSNLGINCTIIQILSLYGYSVSIYIFCILLCSFNICLLHWIFLGYGVANKIYFVFKNIH